MWIMCTQTRLGKRDRKVVDFDRCRREFEHARQRSSVKFPQACCNDAIKWLASCW